MNVAAGIIAIVLAIIVLFQSWMALAVGNVAEALSGSEESSLLKEGGSGGVWVALMLLFAGAFSFKMPRVGSIFATIAFFIAVGIAQTTPYKDMEVWGFLAAVVALLDIFTKKKR